MLGKEIETIQNLKNYPNQIIEVNPKIKTDGAKAPSVLFSNGTIYSEHPNAIVICSRGLTAEIL